MTDELYKLYQIVRKRMPTNIHVENAPKALGYCAHIIGLEKPNHPLAAKGWEDRAKEVLTGDPARMSPQFRVAFGQGEFVRRWRNVPDAIDDNDAIQKVLEGSRTGAMQRLKRRRNRMQAYVSRPNELCHPNGRPILIHGYTLEFS